MEQKMQISSEIDRTELFGNLDVNLNLIKEATGVEMIQREDQLILKGENQDALQTAEALLVTKGICCAEIIQRPYVNGFPCACANLSF